MRSLGNFAKSKSVPLHLDGARILHASTYLGCPVDQLAQHVDSVMMCISKGLGAPVGSLLIGSKDFCKEARRVRKLLGGGMRQAGVLAAAGIVALNTTAKNLHRDHEKNYLFAESLATFDNDVFSIDRKKSETNMTVLNMQNGYSSAQFCTQLETIFADEAHELGEQIQVRLLPIREDVTRATFHLDNTIDDVTAAIAKIKFVVENHCKISEKKQQLYSPTKISSYN